MRASPPADADWFWDRPWILLFAILFIYLNSWGNPFILDDFGHILQNRQIGAWKNWQEAFRQPFFRIEEVGLAQYYRPLVILTYKVEHLLFGKNPFGYHLFNTALHYLNTYLVFVICRTITRRQRLALVTALFFGIHPLQTEEVSYISGLGGLGATSGILASVYFYLKSRQQSRVGFYLFSLFCFGAGLFYKESALILPFLVIWVELSLRKLLPLPARGKRKWRVCLCHAGYFVCLGIYLLLRWWLRERAVFLSRIDAGFWLRFLTFGKGVAVYLRLILFPYGLHFYRSLALLDQVWNLPPLLIVSAGAIILLDLFIRREDLPPEMLVGGGWFAFGLLPFCGFSPIVLENGILYWGEHFLYFPLVGAGLVVSGLFLRCTGSFPNKSFRGGIVWICGLMIAFNYAYLTVRQNRYWSDELLLFERMVRYEPHLFRTSGLLGVAYLKKGEVEKAIEADMNARKILLWRSGVSSEAELCPLDKYQLKIILRRLAEAHCRLSRVPEAKAIVQDLLELFPENSYGYYLGGKIRLQGGEAREALPLLERAYEMNPDHFEVASALILCYELLGDFQRAREVWMEAAERIPTFQQAWEIMKSVD